MLFCRSAGPVGRKVKLNSSQIELRANVESVDWNKQDHCQHRQEQCRNKSLSSSARVIKVSLDWAMRQSVASHPCWGATFFFAIFDLFFVYIVVFFVYFLGYFWLILTYFWGFFWRIFSFVCADVTWNMNAFTYNALACAAYTNIFVFRNPHGTKNH